MRKFTRKPWLWSLLAAWLIGSVIVFWVLPRVLIRLEQQSNGAKIRRAEMSSHEDVSKLVSELQELDSTLGVTRARCLADGQLLSAEQWPQTPEGEVFPLEHWQTYLRGLKEADGIPDRELKILRRDIRLMGLPDPARIPCQPAP